MNKINWRKEFDKKWHLWDYSKKLDAFTSCGEEVKDFISKLLTQQQEEIKKIIEKMKKEDRSAPDRGLDNEHLDYNKALNDLLEKL